MVMVVWNVYNVVGPNFSQADRAFTYSSLSKIHIFIGTVFG